MSDTITIKEKELVQASFEKVAPIAEAAANIFYTKLFELDPSLKPLFKGDIKSQGRKLMNMLGTAVKGLDDPKILMPAVHNLGKRHVGYGVKSEHYAIVGEALLSTLEIGLSDNWNSELRAAWISVYTVLSTEMINASSE